MKRGMIIFCAMLIATMSVASDSDAELARGTRDAVVSRWRILPFFEYQRTQNGGTFWAARPFWSRVNDPVSDTRVCDTVWPLATHHYHNRASWWRAGIAYGSNRYDDPSWSMGLFPLYFKGRTRDGRDYSGLFPIYGRHPHLLFMDDIEFLLFPFRLNYTVKDVRRDYYLWPIVSRVANETKPLSIFPFWGKNVWHDREQSYIMWPFWTHATYTDTRDNAGAGEAWLAWPFFGRVNRTREKQSLFLPPFFSFTETATTVRNHFPWPFVTTEDSASLKKISVWPIWSITLRPDERTWTLGWWIVVHSRITAGARTERRFRLWPFWTDETISHRDEDNTERVDESYVRFWPFFSYERSGDRARTRLLELNPIRHSGGVERNWAPFWTFWERHETADAVKHELFWGLIQWTNQKE